MRAPCRGADEHPAYAFSGTTPSRDGKADAAINAYSGVSRNPGPHARSRHFWIPSFAGMTRAACSVVDLSQVKAASGRHGAASAAITRLERLFQVAGRPLALADKLQRADHGAHLVVQEGASGCLDPDLLADAGHGETVEGLHGRGRLTLGGPEGAEVMVTDESLRRIVHGGGVEHMDHLPGAVALKRQRGRAQAPAASGD